MIITSPASTAYSYPLLIKQLLHTPRAVSKHQEIVYADFTRHTYADMFDRIGCLANALDKLGVKFGDTVAVMDWDSHRYLECFFAIPMMGAVLQTVNVRLTPDQIIYTLEHAEASFILVNEDFLPIWKDIAPKLPHIQAAILLRDRPSEDSLPEGFIGEYETLLKAESSDYCFPDFDENTRATTFYTTGTTGLPKGVYFSHRQLVLHTLGVATALALSPQQGSLHRDDVYMPITPMFHVHAWGLPYVATLAGVKQVYPGRYIPNKLLALRQHEKVTFSHCVPTILQMLLNDPAAEQTDFHGWKMIIGGSALSSGLTEKAKAVGMDVFTGYGMSETCPVLTLAQLNEQDLNSCNDVAKRCQTGAPIPLVDIRTVDSNMNDMPIHESGEIVVRSPWLTQGYLKNPSQSEALWYGGWLHTQDIGFKDDSGWLQITDRMKDVIKTGGEWVSSLDIESVISTHPNVNEVAVIAVKDEKWGERPLALVVLQNHHEENEQIADAIKALLTQAVEAGHLSKYAIPEKIIFVEELAKTSVGKMNKKALREQWKMS